MAFLIAGFAVAAWAPLVPYAKTRLEVDEGTLGLLLLCLGAGSILTMPITGGITARLGCRPVILCSGVLSALLLPILAIAPNEVSLAAALFVFGAAIGTLDVSMNIHAVAVETLTGRALMSGFHGFFSFGGILGAGSIPLLLWAGLTPFQACLIVSVILLGFVFRSSTHLLHTVEAEPSGAPLFVLPRGRILLIGLCCFAMFLAEGAMLDWAALFLTMERGVDAAWGGTAYAAFALAMTVGRFTGDRIVNRFGGEAVMRIGGIMGALGFFLAVLVPFAGASWIGFILIGLGSANLVPVLFTAAGQQPDTPANLALSAITSLGYAGVLAGPAMIGFVAHATSLTIALTGLGVLLLLVAACAQIVAKPVASKPILQP